MTEPACGACVYWRAGRPADARQIEDRRQDPNLGACEASPPVPLLAHGAVVVTVFPVTHTDRACALFTKFIAPDDDGGSEQDEPGATVLPFERAAA